MNRSQMNQFVKNDKKLVIINDVDKSLAGDQRYNFRNVDHTELENHLSERT